MPATLMKGAQHCADYQYTGPQVDKELSNERVQLLAIVEIDGEKKEFDIHHVDVGETSIYQPFLDWIVAHGGWSEQRLDSKKTTYKSHSDAFRKAVDGFESQLRDDIAERYPNLEHDDRGTIDLMYSSGQIVTPVTLGRKEHERRRALFEKFLRDQGAQWSVNCATRYPKEVCERVDPKAADLTPEQVAEAAAEERTQVVVL